MKKYEGPRLIHYLLFVHVAGVLQKVDKTPLAALTAYVVEGRHDKRLIGKTSGVNVSVLLQCSKADDQKLLLLTMHLSAQTLLTAGTVDNVSKTDHVTMLHQSRALVSQLSKAMIGLSLKPSA
eukprot:10911-Heterococcus_DN1.PRE.3